jgi:hypothetical protein
MRMVKCPICESGLKVTACRCDACRTTYEGAFLLPRLARLSKEEQRLAEALIEHGGNLKEMAKALDISYPTLKKRLAELSDALMQLRREDDETIAELFKRIEHGEISAEEGIRLIREVNGEL